jgi:hypothetical protein
MDQISRRRLARGFWGGKEMRWGGGYLRQTKEMQVGGCGVIKRKLSD